MFFDLTRDDVIFKESLYCSVLPETAATGSTLPLPVVTTTTKKPTTAAPASDLDCDFEAGFCKWSNDASATSKWLRQRGQTTLADGPGYDHTYVESLAFIISDILWSHCILGLFAADF